jgi:uncharacterized phage-associated protein
MDERYKYNSVSVAKCIAAYANEHRYLINMTKLQKLLYITYGIYMVVKDMRLTNEHPQAWPYGPVFPTTRNRLLKIDLSSIKSDDNEILEIVSDAEMNSLIAFVFNTFGNKSAAVLSEWSHQSGSPWARATEKPGFVWGDRIPDEYILDYFRPLIKFK